MRQYCSNSAVLWGLVRFSFGSGTFKRDKFIFVHFNGQNVGAVKRGKFTAQKGAVSTALGSCHSDLEISTVDDCTTDHFFEKLNRVFVSDSGQISLAELKAQYMQSVVAGEKPTHRRLASEMKVQAAKVLEAIRQPTGPFNWGLFEPNPTELRLFNGGSLSIGELQRVLPEDQVLYGLIRMGFGAGQFRRTKWVFLHWVGDKTSAVKRGKATAVKGAMRDVLRPFNCDVEIGTKAELDLKAFVTRMTRLFVVDDDGSGKKEEAAFGFEEFMAALAEEQAASAAFFGDTEAPAPPPAETADLDVKETINLVRQSHGPCNWALFELK
eukprot:EG_transcript_16697